MMCRYLAYYPEDEPRIFSDVGFGFMGSSGVMVPFILSLLLDWGLLGMGRRRVGLRMMTVPVQHFYSSILDAWRFQCFCQAI